ncbi:tetratricopeptide repeat protein [candidate division KSB1 bacterium]|nr:tetratricopeptide repeat protein [candidate division KSB1 bacterium]
MKKIIYAIVLIAFVTTLSAQSLLEQAESYYEKRGEKFNAATLLADATNIDQAIKLYEQAMNQLQGDQKAEATWKLIRAYYFKGRYTTKNTDEKKKIYDLGKNIGEKGVTEFQKSPGVFLFTAIVWGVWGEEYGILKAAREGVAGKIKEYCEKSIELDPNFDEAGGYRVLGRVYFKAPKIPFILGWPSTDKAIEFLKKANQIAPKNLTTKQFLAEALYKKDKTQDAMKLMEEVLAEKELIDGIVEDTVVKDEVKKTLADWKK